MRANKWGGRRIGKGPEGPRTIQQIREDAARDGCIYMPQASSPPSSKVECDQFLYKFYQMYRVGQTNCYIGYSLNRAI